MMEDIKNIIESLLFVSETPLTIDRLKGVLDVNDTRTIRDALNRLSEDYETRKGAFYLRSVAGGYQICTRPEYGQWIKRLIQPNPPRLSRAALETLAIIAYKQPIIRNDIEHIRGVDCGGILRQLLERKLIRILGRKEIPGRPLIYATTKDFLEIFDLKDLKDLPTLKEIDAFGNPLSDAAESPIEEKAAPDNQAEDQADDQVLPEAGHSDSAPEDSDPEPESESETASNGKNA